MIENFTAKIGARITEFNKKMREVDKTVKKAAMGATKEIGADIDEFSRKMDIVTAKTKSALRPHHMNVGAKIAEFRRNLSQAQAYAKSVLKRGEKTVGADISSFMMKMAMVEAKSRALNKEIVVHVKASINDYRKKMDRIANSIRTIGEIAGSTFAGIALAISPGLVPVIATLAGAIGTLGPVLGTVAGSTFALVTAFALAGLAAVAFTAVAIPTIKKLFDTTGKLTKQQQAARAEYDKFRETWQEIVKDLENPVLEAFGKAMMFATKVITMARPLFDSAATAVNNLLTSLNASLDSAPMKAFFDYMNTSAGPMLEVVGKGIGWMMQGMFNMMTAFGPLAESTANGFLKMNENFAIWAAGLSKSEKFQSFVTYIQENMPKVKSIFSDALAGIAYFFSAFGPLSSDMMTNLQDMMKRFKEWSKTLSENKAFQDFIGYIRENAPRVVELIGNLAKFIVNLGVALAPMGSKVLDVTNKVLKWTNSMMESSPWFSKLIGYAVVVTGALIVLGPAIVGVTSFLGGLLGIFKILLPIFSSVIGAFWKLGPIILNVGSKILPLLVRALGFLTGPIGLIATLVLSLAYVIWANWDKIKKWTVDTFNSIRKTMNEKMAKGVAEVVTFVKQLPNLITAFKGTMISAGKDLIRGLIDGAISMASNAVSTIKNIAGDMVGAALSFFKIKSPSRVFRAIGEYLPSGLAVGVKNNAAVAIKSVTSMASEMTRAFSPQLAFAGGVSMNSVDAGFQMDELKRQIKQELNVDLYVHGDEARKSNGGTQYGNVYVTVDAKNVKELNDIVRMLDEQEWDSQ